MNKEQEKLTLGVSKGEDHFRASLFAASKKEPTLLACWELPLTHGEDLLSRLSHTPPVVGQITGAGLGDPLTITSVASKELFLRTLTLSLKEEEINRVLPYELEPTLPYPLEEFVFDWTRYPNQKDPNSLAAFAVRKESLKAHLEECHTLSLEPEQVSCQPAALATFANHYLSKDKPLLILHFNNHDATLLLLLDKQPYQLFSLSDSLKDLETFKPTLRRSVYAIRQELSKDAQEQLQYVLTGNPPPIPELKEQLEEVIDSTLQEHPLSFWAETIGLALGPLKGSSPQESVNFRKEEYVYPNPWKRIWKPLAIFGSLVLGLTLFLFLSALFFESHARTQLANNFSTLVERTGQPLTSFEDNYRKTAGLPPLPDSFDKDSYLRNLSIGEIDSRLNFLKEQLKKGTEAFALNAKIPRVSDLLAWLASLPEVVTLDNEGKRKLLITFETIDYTLLSRPDKTHPKEKYKVKVDLTFSALSPKEARAFQEALIAPNAFIDASQEIKWVPAKNNTRVSFILKDKTFYQVAP
jgi:type IV pilus assembly protein PilM